MRLATCRALKGATMAGDRVFDSAIDPIDMTIAQLRQPIVIVTTDDHVIEKVEGRDLTGASVACELVIEAAIAARVELPAGDEGEPEAMIQIPHTDEGMEMMLDLLEHQIIAALLHGRSEWSRVWVKMVPRVTRRLSRRGADTDKGVRFAARQIVLTCDLIEAPVPGAPISAGTSWHALLAAMEADTELAPIAGVLRSTIEGEPLADWRRAAVMLGVSLETANALGIGPILDLSDDPAPLDAADVSGGGLTVDVDQDLLDQQGLGADA